MLLLKKKGRDSIPLGYPVALKNDDLSIYLLDHEVKRNLYKLQDIKRGKIVYSRTDIETMEKETFEANIKDLDKFEIDIYYYYKDWRVTYKNIFVAFIQIYFGFIKVWKIWHKDYSTDLKHFTDRMELLEILVDLYQESEREIIEMESLSEKIYSKTHLKYRSYPFVKDYKNLDFMLKSLVQSGDIESENKSVISYITIKPKALETLSNYEMETSKFKSTQRLVKWQLILSVIMALLTLSNIVLTFMGSHGR